MLVQNTRATTIEKLGEHNPEYTYNPNGEAGGINTSNHIPGK